MSEQLSIVFDRFATDLSFDSRLTRHQAVLYTLPSFFSAKAHRVIDYYHRPFTSPPETEAKSRDSRTQVREDKTHQRIAFQP